MDSCCLWNYESSTDPFSFVGRTPAEKPCIKKKSTIHQGNRQSVYKYVVQLDGDAAAKTYAVKESTPLDLWNERDLKVFIGIWSEWVYLSWVPLHHTVRAVAIRTWPRLPDSVQSALNEFIDTHNLDESEIKTALEKVSASLWCLCEIKVYIIMEYFDSINLVQWCAIHSMVGSYVGIERFMKVVVQCCLAVKELHDIGLVHNDIKLANFLINDEEVVKLCDYGSAQPLQRQPMAFSCTGWYLAPERDLNPNQAGSFKSDVFSLGKVFQALCQFFSVLEPTELAKPGRLTARFKDEFVEPMLDPDPRQRPLVQELLSGAKFQEFIRLIDFEEIRSVTEGMFDRVSDYYHLPKGTPSKSTSLPPRKGKVNFTLVPNPKK